MFFFSKYRKSVYLRWRGRGAASAVCLEEVPYNDPHSFLVVHYKVGVGEMAKTKG